MKTIEHLAGIWLSGTLVVVIILSLYWWDKFKWLVSDLLWNVVTWPVRWLWRKVRGE
jgi:hypothetical protein